MGASASDGGLGVVRSATSRRDKTQVGVRILYRQGKQLRVCRYNVPIQGKPSVAALLRRISREIPNILQGETQLVSAQIIGPASQV